MIAVASSAVATALGIAVVQVGLLPGDEALRRALAGETTGSEDWLNTLLTLTDTGGVAAAAAFTLLLLARRRLRAALLLAATLAGAFGLDQALKELVRRPPISGAGYSYPSGNALLGAAALTAVWALAPARSRRNALAFGALLLGAYGFLLVLAGWHYASDVVGGWAVGTAWAALVAVLLESRGGAGPHRAEGADRVEP